MDYLWRANIPLLCGYAGSEGGVGTDLFYVFIDPLKLGLETVVFLGSLGAKEGT